VESPARAFWDFSDGVYVLSDQVYVSLGVKSDQVYVLSDEVYVSFAEQSDRVDVLRGLNPTKFTYPIVPKHSPRRPESDEVYVSH